MIKFLLSKRVLNLNRKPLHYGSLFEFCNKKPEQPQQQSPSPQPPEPPEQKKFKVSFGNKKKLLLQKTMEKRIAELIQNSKSNAKIQTLRKKHEQLLKNFAKKMNEHGGKKQKTTDDQKIDKQQKELNLLQKFWKSFAVVLFIWIITSGPRQPQKKDDVSINNIVNKSNDSNITLRSINKKQALKQIENSQQNVEVRVDKSFYTNIMIIIQYAGGKKTELITNEYGLIQFLSELEQIRNGSVKVTFNFGIPSKSTNYNTKLYAELLILAMVITTIIATRLMRSKLTQGLNSNSNNFFTLQKPKPINPEQIKIRFSDVAGMHEAKFEVTEFVDFLKQPERYIEMGAKVPKGALLTGPPGTGKTLLAKACAGQANVFFYSVSGSDFVEKFAGLGASRVRALFDQAEKNSPSIIFIDQIDAIGKKRDSGPFSNEERDNTLNQLLVRMDGFDTKNKVIVMAATNRKDMLDPALLRPGRFDRSVEIGLPNFEERQQILKVHLKAVKFTPKITIDELAKKIAVLTPGFSGAELANTCNEAAILAARQNLSQIPVEKFEKATERVMAGLEKRNMFTEQEKQMLAIYECGKAVVSWFTEGSDPIIKISILPFSKSSTGYSHSIKDETALNTKEQLLAKASCYLAGRASQQHFKGYITTNGNNDLARGKKIIEMIVTKFGMSDSLKMIAFPDFDFTRKPYSQKVESLIDEEIVKLTHYCQNHVEQLITSKSKEILLLKEKLIKNQTLTHKCLSEVLGERPAGQNRNYNRYVRDEQEEENRERDPGPGVGVNVQ